MNDGGPAFPGLEYTPGQGNAKFDGVLPNGETAWSIHAPGMTLLDYMAGQALAAFCCHTDVNSKKEDVAKLAYGMGEEMLAERARRYAAAKGATDAKA